MLSYVTPGARKERAALLYIVLVLVLFTQSGCSTLFAPPTATPTLPPTATITPSVTPSPTATNTATPTVTPTATATPDLAATRHVKETATQQARIDELSPELEELGLSTEEGYLAYDNSKAIKLSIENYSSYMPEIIYEENLTDFVMQTTVEWTTDKGFSGCGILFRADEDRDKGALYMYNIMRLQAVPHWFVWYINNSYVEFEVAYPTASRAIKDQQKDINVLSLVVQGEQITPYINGERQRVLTSNKLTEGQIGLNAWTDYGSTTCIFTDTWIWALK